MCKFFFYISIILYYDKMIACVTYPCVQTLLTLFFYSILCWLYQRLVFLQCTCSFTYVTNKTLTCSSDMFSYLFSIFIHALKIISQKQTSEKTNIYWKTLSLKIHLISCIVKRTTNNGPVFLVQIHVHGKYISADKVFKMGKKCI